MTKVLEDVINQVFADAENKISRGIQEIDQFFQSERSKITDKQAEEFVTKYQQLYSEVKQAPLLSLKLKAYQEFNSYLSQIKTQYHDALQKPVIRVMDEIDSHIQALNHLIKAESLILTAFSSYYLSHHLELDEYKKFHEGLEYLQKFVDTYGCYLADSFLKNHLIEGIESIIASNIFDSISEYNLADETAKEVVKNYIQLIKNYAKDVLLSIYRLKPRTFPKRFANLDELLAYWDILYTSEEMDESFEKLSKGLDEERRRQGARTLFS
ncbi:hypothetical protein NIES4071_28140 [Calothrix sp. NIES-4071]|nr:hypothetical protein NIES4071_28140 [Calothrix sp. NIES-4071]BAZ57136.1 hypothetical protein NIES4105_28080 [Calothrix sp. NIES-4105]